MQSLFISLGSDKDALIIIFNMPANGITRGKPIYEWPKAYALYQALDFNSISNICHFYTANLNRF